MRTMTVLLFVSTLATAQPPAAVVNGQPVTEASIQRALRAVPQEDRAKMRDEIVQSMIENMLIDQYLTALKMQIDPKEADTQFETFKKEYPNVLERMQLTEPEMKEQIINQLRWEKFVSQQATDAKLEEMFKQIPEAFDGTAVRARQILFLMSTDVKSNEAVVGQLRALKSSIQSQVDAGLAKLPADVDAVTKAKERLRLVDDAFGEAAKQHSQCPSKKAGGNLDWFPRIGTMIEPLAKGAFALKPGEISDVIATPVGFHLILCTDRRPGKPVPFAEVKKEVEEVYGNRLREAVVTQMRPRSKIEITPVK